MKKKQSNADSGQTGQTGQTEQSERRVLIEITHNAGEATREWAFILWGKDGRVKAVCPEIYHDKDSAVARATELALMLRERPISLIERIE